MKPAFLAVVVFALTVVACGRSAVPVATNSTTTSEPAATTPPATTGEAATAGATASVAPPTGPSGPEEQPGADSGTATSPDTPGPAPTPDLQGFRTAPAPGELASVTLPKDFSEVRALFERLPAEVAGHARSAQFDRITPARSLAGYGEDRRIPNAGNPLLAIQAMDLAQGDFFPTNWSGGQVAAEMSRRGEEVKDAGRDGDLIWLRQDTFMGTPESPERFPVYTMLWGRIDSPWMFSVSADSPENRDALLAAFVAAAKATDQ